MKKKGIRITAAAMSLVMLLTSCSDSEKGIAPEPQPASAEKDAGKEDTASEPQFVPAEEDAGKEDAASEPQSVPAEEDAEEAQIDKAALSLYTSSPVTQVEEQPFSMSGYEGVYTGDWKGNRPEGQGSFVMGEYDFCSGEWYNGMLQGQGQMQRTYEDGIWKRFEGEFSYNRPSGEGRMYIGSFNDTYLIDIQGNFSNENSLMFFMTDGDGKLINIGNFRDGDYVSFVGDPNIQGLAFKDWIRNSMEGAYYYTQEHDGVYVGQVDENNVPNGYGYSVSNRYGTTVYKLGTWKDGVIDGYYTEWWYNGRWTTRVGCMEDRVDVGKCVTYSEESNYRLVTSMDCKTAYEYQLCDDGKYRTDYVTNEYYYHDGRYRAERYLTLRTDLNGWEYWYEGEYTVTDADGNVIECGTADPRSRCSLSWISSKDSRKKEIWDTLAPIVAVGLVVGLGAYALSTWGDDFESSSAGKMLADSKREAATYLSENQLREELLEKSEGGAGARTYV